MDSVCHSHAETNTHSYSDADHYVNADSEFHPVRNIHSERDIDCHTYENSDPDMDSVCHSYAATNPYTNTHVNYYVYRDS
jgi:hypothetical protein